MFLVSFQNIKNNNNLQDKIIITTELCFQVEKTFFFIIFNEKSGFNINL